MSEKPNLKDTAFEAQLVNLFECPVCFNYMSPPIYQCDTGHMVCQHCFLRLESCPRCRASKSLSQAHIMEKISLLLKFPCRFKEDGCTFVSKGDIIDRHMSLCWYQPEQCPVIFWKNCHWVGKRRNTFDHLKKCHPEKIAIGDYHRFETSTEGTGGYRMNNSVIFINAYNTIFRAFWERDTYRSAFRFAVTLWGESPVEEEEFSYKLSILTPETEHESYVQTFPCYSLPDDDYRLGANESALIPFSVFSTYTNGEQKVCYSVRIIKNLESRFVKLLHKFSNKMSKDLTRHFLISKHLKMLSETQRD